MSLTVRYPKFDFSNLPRFWAKNKAFGYGWVAASMLPTPIEPWLIRMLQSSVERLGPRDAGLKEDVKGFIGQESQHFRQHRVFNKTIQENGYPQLAEMEQQLADELAHFEKTKSLKFLLAYADGFESMGAASAQLWFGQLKDIVAEADPHAADLWGWHLAEEFEHRSVMFDFYKALYCRGPIKSIVNGYFYRIYGLLYAMIHLGGFTQRMTAYMTSVDKQDMTQEERDALTRELGQYAKMTNTIVLRKLALNLLPWYNPKNKKAPEGLKEYLARFEPGGDMARQSAGKSEPAGDDSLAPQPA